MYRKIQVGPFIFFYLLKKCVEKFYPPFYYWTMTELLVVIYHPMWFLEEVVKGTLSIVQSQMITISPHRNYRDFLLYQMKNLLATLLVRLAVSLIN